MECGEAGEDLNALIWNQREPVGAKSGLVQIISFQKGNRRCLIDARALFVNEHESDFFRVPSCHWVAKHRSKDRIEGLASQNASFVTREYLTGYTTNGIPCTLFAISKQVDEQFSDLLGLPFGMPPGSPAASLVTQLIRFTGLLTAGALAQLTTQMPSKLSTFVIVIVTSENRLLTHIKVEAFSWQGPKITTSSLIRGLAGTRRYVYPSNASWKRNRAPDCSLINRRGR